METARENKIREIFDEVARSSNLDRALAMIAAQIAADLGAPACKIWVVKRGDICDHCPLAHICTNRQMCMHLVAASGTIFDREYPRIPMTTLNATLIAHGGMEDFSEPGGAGEILFGLQRSHLKDTRDSYAIYPLKGASGTVGLIGIFHHRPIEEGELSTVAQFSPAAVAAIRLAEMHSRCDALRARLEKESSRIEEVQLSTAARENELEDAVATLTHQVANMQVERDQLQRANDDYRQRLLHLEEENRQLKSQSQHLASIHNESNRSYSEMTAHLEVERRSLEEENAWLKSRVAEMETSQAQAARQREETVASFKELHALKAQLDDAQKELDAERQSVQKLQERVLLFDEWNTGLRDHNATLSESLDDLERSLRIAEDARARVEQSRIELEEKLHEANEETERLRAERSELLADVDRARSRAGEDLDELRLKLAELESLSARTAKDNDHLNTLTRELTQERAADKRRIIELEQENAQILESNQQLEEAIKQFESLSARLEESALKLGDRAESDEVTIAELEQSNRALSEQNRRLRLENQNKARFLADMSHELRTPMNAIIGFTSLLTEDHSLDISDRQRGNLERVARNARDLLELINNVLDLSKIDAGRMDVYAERVALDDLIERSLSMVEPLKENRSLRLVSKVEEGLTSIRTDRTRLQQVLFNLLSNAVRFTPEGEVKVSARRAGTDEVVIEVSDTGVGISQSDLPRIFEEFWQAEGDDRAKRSGTGLGLAITRRLIDLLGGSIGAVSEIGKGTTFTLLLPMEIEGPAVTPAEAEIAPSDTERTALVIDGDPTSLYLIKKYLTEAGYSVAATDDAGRGLEIARMAQPAIVTIDIDLLDNAFQMLSEIKGGDSNPMLVAVSASSAFERRALDAGADIFLSKPIERARLVRSLDHRTLPRTGRVMIIDDDTDSLDLASAAIEDSGYKIITARSGREALEKLARERPDAIILDLMLPEMDGFEVVHRLSLNPDWRTIPVILLTARSLSSEERRAVDVGTVRLIQKGDFNRDELLRAIEGTTESREAEKVAK
jgi:CheY-like chemotaxis protein